MYTRIMSIPPAPPSSYTLTLNEAATLLDVSTKTVQRAVKAGRLSCVRVPARRGHQLRFRPDEVRKLLPAVAPPAVFEQPVPLAPPLARPTEASSATRVPASVASRPTTRREKQGRQHHAENAAPLVQALGRRLDGMDARLAELTEQQQALTEALALHQKTVGDALAALPHQFSDALDRAARAAALAAAARERAAWLEAAAADSTRALEELRQQLAPPPAASAKVEDEADAEAQVSRPWWKKLMGG